jgi:hypothetical protein
MSKVDTSNSGKEQRKEKAANKDVTREASNKSIPLMTEHFEKVFVSVSSKLEVKK